MNNRIIDLVDLHRAEIMKFTKELVSIPTENPPGRYYRECVELIEHEMKRLDLDYRILEVPVSSNDGIDSGNRKEFYPRYCILGGYEGIEKSLYFHGHYDVVPATSREQFLPRVENGKLYGRGTADMKSGLAAMIYAVKVLHDCKVKLEGGVRLVIVPDEETGGISGTQWLHDKGLLNENCIGMLTAEPTSGVIWSGNRGAISLRVTIEGKPVHAVLQHEGINAFEKMLLVANELVKLKGEVETRRTNLRIEPDGARHSILMIGGTCHSGISFNSVPAECSFTVDRRINPEEDLVVERKELFDIFEKMKREGIDIDVEILQEGSSSSVNEDCPVARALSTAVAETAGSIPKLEMCPGLLETRFYSTLGIPGLAYGPGLLSVSHGPSEYVEIENIYRCTAIYALTATQLLRS